EVGTICRDIFFRHNLIMRACGDHMVSAPPLIISKAEIDQLIGTAVQCVTECEQVLRERGLA
ncbi:MAG TPA: aspartate aminotransferase family protein, partial [Pseudogulbenkiania sp.]|nr:aspartate aminotransferase family protein [Pseudogulbenkiania sp.]